LQDNGNFSKETADNKSPVTYSAAGAFKCGR